MHIYLETQIPSSLSKVKLVEDGTIAVSNSDDGNVVPSVGDYILVEIESCTRHTLKGRPVARTTLSEAKNFFPKGWTEIIR